MKVKFIDSNFTQNSGRAGSCIAAEFESTITTENCHFYENFGLFAPVSWTAMDASINHTGGSMFNNLASSYPLAEISESGKTSYFNGVEIYDNKQLAYEDLRIEGLWCLNLCYID